MQTIIVIQNSITTLAHFRTSYLNKLLSEGHHIYCIAPIDNRQKAIELVDRGISVAEIRKPESLMGKVLTCLQMNIQILNLTLRNRKSVLVCHFIVTFLMCFPALLFSRVRNLVYVEGLGSAFHGKPNRIFFLRVLLRLATSNVIFCNSHERKLLGHSTDIVTGGIGIELDQYIRFTKSYDFSLNQQNSGSFNILFVGRLIEDKGIIDLLNAFREIRKTIDNVKLTVVGTIDPNNPSSITNAELDIYRAEFLGQIEWTGQVDNVLPFYQSSQVLILPSYCEGSPVCVMEASACGIPSIVYDAPGSNETVVNNVNGYIVEFRNISEIVSRILLLYSDLKLREKFKRTCQNHAIASFDRRIQDGLFLKRLQSLLVIDE